ncbi:hypothetical protein PMEGAPL103_33830 [Priestia megaterium]
MICRALIRQQYTLLNNYKGQKEEWVIPLLLSRQFILIKDGQPLIGILFQLIRCSNKSGDKKVKCSNKSLNKTIKCRDKTKKNP